MSRCEYPRCSHCGMPRDRSTLDGSCPHCADIYPGTDPAPDNAVRCDGCGHERSEANTFEDDGTTLGTYCWGCQQILEEKGVDPGDHEQYSLMEGAA